MMTHREVFDLFAQYFGTFSESALVRLEKTGAFAREPLLFHYSTLPSLQRIIESRSFSSTSIFMMNDPNELTFGYEHLKRYLPEAFYLGLGRHQRYKSHFGFPAFVFCLTELGDDMYCWDKYGNGHRGIRIGFTPESITRYWRQIQDNVVYLAPVIYLDDDGTFGGDYREEFEQFWTKFVIETVRKQIDGGLAEEAVSALSYCISLTASLLRRREWSSEREWRVVNICSGYMAPDIEGDMTDHGPVARLVGLPGDTLELLTNKGHGGLASMDILKIGSLAGNLEFVEYTIKLLMRKATGENFFDDVVTQSAIQTR